MTPNSLSYNESCLSVDSQDTSRSASRLSVDIPTTSRSIGSNVNFDEKNGKYSVETPFLGSESDFFEI